MNNAEDIIEYFIEKKVENIINIKNNIQKKDKTDKWCCDKKTLIFKDQRCLNCQLCIKLCKDEIFENNIQIQINKGSYKNKIYSINIFLSDIENCYIRDNIIKKISNNIMENLSCFTKKENFKIDNVYFLKNKNKYQQLFLIYNIFDEIFLHKNLITNYRILHNYNCKNKYVMLKYNLEYNNIKELLENDIVCKNGIIKEKNVKSIILQIYYYLEILSKYYFCHNNLDINHLKFSSELTKIEIDENKFSSFLKVYLEPSFFSNISLYDHEKNLWYRYFFSEEEIIKNISLPIESFFYSYIEEEKILFYKIGMYKKNFINYRINYGVPLMINSFDMVCILSSLYIEKSLKENIIKSKVWKNIWRPSEYNSVCQDLDKIKDNDFQNIYNIITKYFIRINLMNYIKYNIKEI